MNSTFVLLPFNEMPTKRVYIVSYDTCPPLYWYFGVSRRPAQHVPPMLTGGGTFLFKVKRHLKKSTLSI